MRKRDSKEKAEFDAETATLKEETLTEEKYPNIILQVISKYVVPIIFVFGIYVVLNGHISPGGGFSGGAIIGAGLILYAVSFGEKKSEEILQFQNIYSNYKWCIINICRT